MQNHETLSPEEFHTILLQNRSDSNFVLLDIRPYEKFRKFRLKGAVNLDYNSDDFDDELEKLERKKIYMVYCSLCTKSNIVLGMMEDLKFKKVYIMDGGINAWHKTGLPLQQDE